MPENTRKFVSIREIQAEYLPFSEKKIRLFVQKHLPYCKIGRAIYVERVVLEDALKQEKPYPLK